MKLTTTEQLQKIARLSLVDSFIESEQKDENLNEALGVAISQWAEWNGYKICEVFASALEDSNFHMLAGQVFDWMDLMMNPQKED